MFADALTRRNFAARLAPVISALGLASLLPSTAMAKNKTGGGVRKLSDQGKPSRLVVNAITSLRIPIFW